MPLSTPIGGHTSVNKVIRDIYGDLLDKLVLYATKCASHGFVVTFTRSQVRVRSQVSGFHPALGSCLFFLEKGLYFGSIGPHLEALSGKRVLGFLFHKSGS